MDDLKSVLPKPSIFWTLEKYVNSMGEIIDNDGQAKRSAISNIFYVTEGDFIKLNMLKIDKEGNTYFCNICTYNNGTFVGRCEASKYSIPDGVNEVRFSLVKSTTPLTSEDIEVIFDAEFFLKSVSRDLWRNNFGDLSEILSTPTIKWMIGAYINASGSLVTSDGEANRSAISTLVKCHPGDTIDNTNLPNNDGEGHSVIIKLNFYADGVWQSRITMSAYHNQIIPDGINGIRFSVSVATVAMTDKIIETVFKAKLYLKPVTNSELYDTFGELFLTKSLSKLANLCNLGWEYGYIDIENFSGILYQDRKTIVSPQYIFAKAGTVFSSTDDFQFRVVVYRTPSNSTYVTRSYLDEKSFTVPDDCFVRLVIKNPANDDNDINDIYQAVSHISTDKPIYVLDPFFYKNAFETEKNTGAVDRFIRAMNDKAAQIGMSNSVFADVMGGDIKTSRVTARDMVRMGIEACAYNDLCRVWQTNKYVFHTLDSARREIVCEYGTAEPQELQNLLILDALYPVLGKKNGYMPLGNGNKSFTMVSVCQVNEKILVGAIGGAESRTKRPVAMQELMTNAKRILDGETPQTPTEYLYGCVAELPTGNVVSYERKDLNWIYTYDADTQFVPASCTKVMTAMVMLDYITDLHEKIEVSSVADLGGRTDYLLHDGDIINFKQALYLMMLPSNGATCKVVARVVGTQILVDGD